MTILTLDDGLQEAEWNAQHYPRPKAKAEIERGCLSRGAVNYDWRTKVATEREIVFASNVPDNAALWHRSYLDYLSRTFAGHHRIELAPQHFWYTILCEIAQAVVKNPEHHRSLFTRDPEGKIDIIVPCEDEAQPLDMDALYGEMIGLIPVDTALFLPRFSTETEMSRLASLAAFLETASPFYNYMMMLCGHPQIRLAGTTSDWGLVAENLERLHREFSGCEDSRVAGWITDTALPTAVKILKGANDGDTAWFRDIFSEQRCGSGGQTVVDGWFSRLFMVQPRPREAPNFPTHITKVPYKTLPSGTEWNMCFGLFHSDRDDNGFMVPDFSWVQVQRLAKARVTQPATP